MGVGQKGVLRGRPPWWQTPSAPHLFTSSRSPFHLVAEVSSRYYRRAMERRRDPGTEGSATPGFRDCPAWAICLLGLIAWQGWMTLSLFGPSSRWENLLDDQPILSGRHPLHLYHGALGAQSFRDRGSLCCYDPAYQ